MCSARLLVFLLGMLVSMLATAFPCYITLVKDNCWKDYDVSVDVKDASNNKVLKTIVIAAGEAWARGQWACEPKQRLLFLAKFTPAFWKDDEGKIYSAKHYWSLPEAVTEGTTIWNIPVCYPTDFSGVPLPPDASGACQCDMTKIPALKG